MNLKLKKGLKLNIAGGLPQDCRPVKVIPAVYAIVPDDFPGFIPKLCVKEGDSVALGTPLLYNKTDESVKICSPVAGTVKAIVRGERRKILRVEVETSSDAETTAEVQDDDVRKILAENGVLALMRQRPYDIVPVSYTHLTLPTT